MLTQEELRILAQSNGYDVSVGADAMIKDAEFYKLALQNEPDVAQTSKTVAVTCHNCGASVPNSVENMVPAWMIYYSKASEEKK